MSACESRSLRFSYLKINSGSKSSTCLREKTLTYIYKAFATLQTRYPTLLNPTNPSTLPFKPEHVENIFLSHLPSLSISFYCPSRRSTLIIRPIASSAIAFEFKSGQNATKIPRSLQISLSILSAFAPAMMINLI